MSFIVDILPYLKKDFDITLWGVSADGERDEGEIYISSGRYPFRVFSDVKTGRRLVPNIVRVVWNLGTRVEEILSEAYDIIYFHGIPLSYPFLRKKQRGKCPKIVNHVHGITNPFSVSGKKLVQNALMIRLYEKYRRWVVEKSDLVLLASDIKGYEDFLKQYESSVSANKIRHIPNFADPNIFVKTDKEQVRNKLGQAHGTSIFVNAGRLSPQKDPALLIESFACLRHEKGVDAQLVLIGDGELRPQIEKLIESKRLSSNVFLTGRLPREEIAQWLNAADVYVYTSHGNGFPIALVEAALCGLPIVTTDIVGVHDIVIEDETGYLVQRREPRDIADKMAVALRNRGRMETCAIERAREFTPQMTASRITEALKSLL